MDVRQAEIAPLEAEGKLLVIEAHEVQHGRLNVVYVNWVFDRREP